jgi:hypothetical protein
MSKSKGRGKLGALAKLDEKTIVCSYVGCGKSFNRPIEAKVIGPDGTYEIYDACPYCFSKVVTHRQHLKPSEKISPLVISPDKDLDMKKSGEKKHKEAACPYSFGYLSNRPKGTPIPDACLTCPKITKCMLQ